MFQKLLELILPLVFLLIYVIGVGYVFNRVWFKYNDFQANLLKENEQRKDKFPYLIRMANGWIRHWTYKWFARIATSFMLIIGGITLLAYIFSLLN